MTDSTSIYILYYKLHIPDNSSEHGQPPGRAVAGQQIAETVQTGGSAVYSQSPVQYCTVQYSYTADWFQPVPVTPALSQTLYIPKNKNNETIITLST